MLNLLTNSIWYDIICVVKTKWRFIMQIYKITNLITGKVYVGQTTMSVEQRWALHIRDFERGRKATYPLYRAFAKYGVDKFKVEVIHDNIETCEELDRLERHYIKELNTMSPNGYNLTAGGQGVHGYHHTDKTKKLFSEFMKSHYDQIYTQERADKISTSLKGRKLSDEHRRKISENAKLRVGEKNPFFGRTHSDATRKRISEANSLHRDIIQCDLVTGEQLNRFASPEEAARYVLSLHRTTATEKSVCHGIDMCCHGHYKKSYGFVWKFVNKEV